MEGADRIHLFHNTPRVIAAHGTKTYVGFTCLLVDDSVAVSHFCQLFGIDAVTMANSPLIDKLPADAAAILGGSDNLSPGQRRISRFISRANVVIYLRTHPGLCADPEAFVQALFAPSGKRRKQAMDNDILREFERGKAEAYAAGKADGEQELEAARSYLSNVDIILSSEN